MSIMTRGFDVKRLLPPDEAVERFFARVTLPEPRVENVALEEARTRILAADAVAREALPPASRSAMDGFAVRAASTPATLRIVGDVRMGERATRVVAPDEAMRVPTGGVLPAGTDAVVPIEDAVVEGESVRVAQRVDAGASVVPRAADVSEGERLLARGRRIGSPEIAVLASIGIAPVPVYRRPLVGVISTGDELIPPSRQPHEGQVRDSNRYAIAASLEALGAQVRHFAIVRDVQGALEQELRAALSVCDAVAISGGSSVGAHDRTPDAIASLGDPGVIVHGLRVRPGKPTVLGAVGVKPVLGLPGNPLSALLVLEAVAAPIVARLCGTQAHCFEREGRLTEPLSIPRGWTWHVPVAVEGDDVRPLNLRSFSTSLAARSDGYVVADRSYEGGERVRVRRFLDGGRS
jgi:molybdopterin molybdotransferase